MLDDHLVLVVHQQKDAREAMALAKLNLMVEQGLA
jgi:hypothetical protein